MRWGRVITLLRRRAVLKAHLPLAPSLVFQIPQRRAPVYSNPSTAGAKLIISLNGGREVNHFPQRRARAPLACLRAIRRGAQSRAPDLRSGPPHGNLLIGCRARDSMFRAHDPAGVRDRPFLAGRRGTRIVWPLPEGGGRGRRERGLRYISTRQSDGRGVSFEHALLQGLARDGGLYLPAAWPALDAATLEGLRGRPYAQVAAAVMACFTGRAFSRASLEAIAAESFAGFDHPATAPLIQLGPNLWLQELFHGPTLAFKDFRAADGWRASWTRRYVSAGGRRRSSPPPRATRALPRSRRSAAGTRSPSSCSTRRGGSPKCSGAR